MRAAGSSGASGVGRGDFLLQPRRSFVSSCFRSARPTVRRLACASSGKIVVRPRRATSSSTPMNALGGDEAELRQMAAQRVDAHRSLLDQQLPGLVQHQHGLLIRALDRHETHVGPRHRLADRRRVGRVVLAALDVGLDVGGAINTTSCPIARKLARPIVRRSAGLHADAAGRESGQRTRESSTGLVCDSSPSRRPARSHESERSSWPNRRQFG